MPPKYVEAKLVDYESASSISSGLGQDYQDFLVAKYPFPRPTSRRKPHINMRLYTTFMILGAFLCISVQANEHLEKTNELVQGTVAWQHAFDAAVDRVYNNTGSSSYIHHDNNTDHGMGVHERSTAINTKWPSDPGDMHYWATFWGQPDCKGKSIYYYTQWMFISSSCQTVKGKAMSFGLMGNLDMCQHFWYWDDQCSDPAELNAVWGDVSCYNGPGDPGKQKIGSFRLRCKDSDYA